MTSSIPIFQNQTNVAAKLGTSKPMMMTKPVALKKTFTKNAKSKSALSLSKENCLFRSKELATGRNPWEKLPESDQTSNFLIWTFR
jgi:hypothetical protein